MSKVQAKLFLAGIALEKAIAVKLIAIDADKNLVTLGFNGMTAQFAAETEPSIANITAKIGTSFNLAIDGGLTEKKGADTSGKVARAAGCTPAQAKDYKTSF